MTSGCVGGLFTEVDCLISFDYGIDEVTRHAVVKVSYRGSGSEEFSDPGYAPSRVLAAVMTMFELASTLNGCNGEWTNGDDMGKSKKGKGNPASSGIDAALQQLSNVGWDHSDMLRVKKEAQNKKIHVSTTPHKKKGGAGEPSAKAQGAVVVPPLMVPKKAVNPAGVVAAPVVAPKPEVRFANYHRAVDDAEYHPLRKIPYGKGALFSFVRAIVVLRREIRAHWKRIYENRAAIAKFQRRLMARFNQIRGCGWSDERYRAYSRDLGFRLADGETWESRRLEFARKYANRLVKWVRKRRPRLKDLHAARALAEKERLFEIARLKFEGRVQRRKKFLKGTVAASNFAWYMTVPYEGRVIEGNHARHVAWYRRRLSQWIRKMAKKRYAHISLYQRMDRGYWVYVVLAAALVYALVQMALSELGERMAYFWPLIYPLIVTVLILSRSAVFWWRYGDVQLLDFQGFSSKFEYTTLTDTSAFSALTGRISYFIGSGYNSVIRVASKKKYVSKMMDILQPTVVTRHSCAAGVQAALVFFENELEPLTHRRKQMERVYIEHAAQYVVQTLELIEAQRDTRTSLLTGTGLADRDFQRRGGVTLTLKRLLRTTPGLPPPSN